MKGRLQASLLFAISAVVPSVGLAMHWSPEVAGGGQQHGGGHAAHGRPAARALVLHDGEGASAEMWLPTLERKGMALEGGKTAIKPSGLDNYHLFYAVRESEQMYETAFRYHYMNGKPSKRSPSELVNADKAALEIIPTPLPREHARYTSERPAAFLVRFQGKPVAELPIALETSNGTRLFTKTDQQGHVLFMLPQDFPHIAVGRSNNPPAEFFLWTRQQHEGREYRTSLSAAYHVNPRHWQSQDGALWVGLAGFVAGLGILGLAGGSKNRPAKG